MTLRVRKRLLLAGTLSCVAAAGVVAAWAWEPPPLPEPPSVPPRGTAIESQRNASAPGVPTAAEFQSLVARPLRQPLYDPPPPPPPVVEKPPPRPLQARLLATMIEAQSSMAMLDVGGRVEFRKVGDVVSTADAEARLSRIESGSVEITRGDETITLTVDGS